MLRVAAWLAALLFAVAAANQAETDALCTDILPTYELDNGATFDTKALFEFVALLPPYLGYEEYRALIELTRERCGLDPPLADVRSFRSACYVLERSFLSHRRTPPRIDKAKTNEEAAALAALSLAREAMMREPSGCYSMCPCTYVDDVCPTSTDDGDCVLPASPTALPRSLMPVSDDPLQTEEETVELEESMEPLFVLGGEQNFEDALEPLPTMTPTPSATETPMPSSSASSLPSPSQSSMPLPSLSSTPSPSGSPTASVSATPKVELNETREPTTFSGGKPPPLTPLPLSDTEANASVQGVGLSKPAVIGIAIGGVVLIGAVALVAVQQIAFRRRHADEIEQWRNAFRVVED